VNPLISGFDSLPRSLAEASHVLGKSSWQTLFRVLLPNMRPALIAGAVLSFAHTLGEFGLVLMIGGKIPGVTRVASIAIYDEVEMLHFPAANRFAIVLTAVSFVILLVLFVVNRKRQNLF
jgi:molybdate transport system permease protein